MMLLKKIRFAGLLLVAALPWLAAAQTITITNGVQRYASLTATTVDMSGKCELWVTNISTPLSGCTINLNSSDAWLFLPGVKPSTVAASYLSQLRVNGGAAVADGTVRVVQYGQRGTVVIPHSPAFQPLTVYSDPQFGGASTPFSQWTYYTGNGIAPFSSFKLKRGYQVVFAQSSDGKNLGKCYVAQDGDLEIGVLPATLEKQVQFIYVTPWRWTAKKGVSGDPGIGLLNLLWWYNWNISSSSSRDLEYVAIRQSQGWPPLNQNWQSLGINTLLGYNEPDQANQANMSVATAISSWDDLLATGLRVGSPATSDGGPSSWLFPFVQQADAAGLRVDFVAVHYYQGHNPADAAGCASQMLSFLQNIWNNTHRPIWITEWNNGANWTDNNPWPAPTYAQQQACIAAMVNMLETTPFVERYALYNWVEDVRSVVTNGAPTPAGTTYSNQVSNLSYSQVMPDNGTRGIAQYLFASNTLDTSGYGNNAMAVGAPAYTTGHNGLATAIVLDGTNSYLQLPANIAKAAGFTFAGWIYWNGGPNWQRIFDFGNDTSHYLFLTPSSGSGTLRFAINNGGGEQMVQSAALAVGSWQHVAVTLSGNTAVIYLNGAAAASSAAFSIAPSNFNPTRNFFGESQFVADPQFNGRLDGIQIRDFAMTPSEIAALYSGTPSAIPPFIAGVWTNDADGNWSATNNWSGGVVANGGSGVDYSADFSTLDITVDRAVTLDSNRSIGTLKFGDVSGSQNWTLAGPSALTLDAPAPFIFVNQNTATITAPLAGNNGFTKRGPGTLILAGSNFLSGTINADSGSTSASDGVLRVANPGGLGGVSRIQFRNGATGSSTLQLDGASNNLFLGQTVSLNGRSSTVPAIQTVGGTNTLAGGFGVSGSGNYVIQVDSGLLNVSGTISPSDGGSDAITFHGNGNASLNGTAANGTGTMGVNKAGSGTLAIGPGSSYSGWTTVASGTLALQGSPTPLFHLTFDNPAGSGNGSIITNAGLAGPSMNGTLVGTGASIVSGGRFGNALSLNGVGGNALNNIVIVSNKVMNTDASGSWTVGYWLKTSTAGAVIMYQGNGGWSSAGQTTFYLNNNGTTAGTHAGAVRWAGGWLTGTAALNNNAWHFITLVDNAGTETIYVDGVPDIVTSSMANPLASSANQIWIGGSPDPGDGATKMTGLIDEVYLFNRALSPAEVQSLYTTNAITTAPVNALPVTTPVNVAPNATLDLAGIPQTLIGLSGGGLVTNSGAPATLTVSNTTSPSLFAGTIGDALAGNAVSVSKNGSGLFALAGPNTYHGGTTVSGGTLKLSPVADDSVLHLTFDNAAGSSGGAVVTNTGLGGAAMNGTIVGGSAVIVSGGRFGNALSLNGVGGSTANNIVLINNKVLNTDASGTWSVGYWLKTSTAGAVIMYQGDGTWSSAGQTMFYLNNNGTVPGTRAGAVRWAGGWLTGTAALNNNAWHFVMLVADAGTETIYVDGNPDAVTSTMGGALSAGANQVWIGGSPDSGDGATKMNGLIDEVYMFNRALSQAEVQALYNNNVLATNSGNVLPPWTPVSVNPGAVLDLGGVSQTIASLSGGGVVTNTGNPATLTISNIAGTAPFAGSIGDFSATKALSLVQTGGGTTILTGASAYRGTTTVAGGKLLVHGSLGTNVVSVSGGTLGGNGVIGGTVNVQPGGTLAPGASIGSLTINGSLTLSGITSMELDKSSLTSDTVHVLGALIYGGTLSVTNLGGSLVPGDSFNLFYASSFAGAFSALNPPTPGPGLLWNTNMLAVDGTLRVQTDALQSPALSSSVGTGGNIVFAGVNGTPFGGWSLWSTTNLSLPLNNWHLEITGSFDVNGAFAYTNLLNPGVPAAYFVIRQP